MMRRLAAKAAPTPPPCAAAWRPGWQQLANRVQARLLPDLDAEPARRGHEGADEERRVGQARRSWPRQLPLARAAGAGRPRQLPRLSGPYCDPALRGHPGGCGEEVRHATSRASATRSPRTGGRFSVTPYTVNQGVDQWHVLYLWRERGSIYTVSQHVAKPTHVPPGGRQPRPHDAGPRSRRADGLTCGSRGASCCVGAPRRPRSAPPGSTGSSTSTDRLRPRHFGEGRPRSSTCSTACGSPTTTESRSSCRPCTTRS